MSDNTVPDKDTSAPSAAGHSPQGVSSSSDHDEKTLTRMVALDPTVSSSKPWIFETRSPYLTKVMIGVMVLVVLGAAFMTVAVGTDENGAALSVADDLAFVGLGIIGLLLCLLIRRPRVRANEDGVEVRNFLGTRFYPWEIVYGLAFPKGDRWARLELPEFEFVPMLAFQAGDGEQVVKKVHEFRELEDKYMPDE